MSAFGKLRVTKIVEEWNMNCVHKLREDKGSRTLKKGDCLVAFNKKQTIGRIIDFAGGVHTYYARKKEVFDIQSLSALVETGFYIELSVGAKTRQQASELKRAA
ncbi:MAG: hypothetical protein WBG86_16020 [Polyangiales bacterium]